MRRFICPDIPLNINSQFSIPQHHINHLLRVLRVKINDTLQISDGKGNIITGEVLIANSDAIIIQILKIDQGKEKALQSIAFLAELKSDSMDNAISILAEHGITRIIPFFANRSIPSFDKKQAIKKQERRQKIVDESIKKVGGLYLGTIDISLEFKQLKDTLTTIDKKIVFYESEDSPSQKLNTVDFSKPTAFFIGPEGGFTDKEIQQLSLWGCENYSLGTRILRAPQACSAAATLIRYFTENNML